MFDMGALGKLGAATQKKFENFPEDLRVTKACDDAGVIRKRPSWTNSLLPLTIFSWQDSVAQAHVESLRFLEMIEDPN